MLVDLQVDAPQTWFAPKRLWTPSISRNGTAQPPALARACRATSQSVKRASGMVITTNATPAARLGDRLNRRFDVNRARLSTSSRPTTLSSAVSFCRPMKSLSSGGMMRRTAWG